MSNDEIDRMDVARHLLPPPGDEVAGQLIAEVRRLRLTDAERSFLQDLRRAYDELANQTGYGNAASQKEAREFADLLQGLLERHGGAR